MQLQSYDHLPPHPNFRIRTVCEAQSSHESGLFQRVVLAHIRSYVRSRTDARISGA